MRGASDRAVQDSSRGGVGYDCKAASVSHFPDDPPPRPGVDSMDNRRSEACHLALTIAVKQGEIGECGRLDCRCDRAP